MSLEHLRKAKVKGTGGGCHISAVLKRITQLLPIVGEIRRPKSLGTTDARAGKKGGEVKESPQQTQKARMKTNGQEDLSQRKGVFTRGAGGCENELRIDR